MDEHKAKFVDDAFDLLTKLDKNILLLEKSPLNKGIVEQIFRDIHTLKGGASMFELSMTGNLCHSLESLYEEFRAGTSLPDKEVFDLSLEVIDYSRKLLENQEVLKKAEERKYQTLLSRINEQVETYREKTEKNVSGKSVAALKVTYMIYITPGKGIPVSPTSPINYTIEELKELGQCLVFPKEHSGSTKKQRLISEWYIYLSAAQAKQDILDHFMFEEDDYTIEVHELIDRDILTDPQIVEYIKSEIARGEKPLITGVKHFINSLKKVIGEGTEKKRAQKENKQDLIKVSRGKLNKIMNWVSELVTVQASLKLLAAKESIPELTNIVESAEIITQNLQDHIFGISLVPIDHLTVRIERLIRNLSRELGKKVDFQAFGTDTELDKSIIEQLSDPLMHILRNSMDHGIESPAERKSRGKNEIASIKLNAWYSGTQVIIEIEDDGRGIDEEKVRKKALEKGLIDEHFAGNSYDIYQLLFLPGFSTSSEVTDVSGRGVGMDVVKKAIDSLRGFVEIESEQHKGTKTIITLPLSLSVIEGLLVQVGETRFLVPTSSIRTCYSTNENFETGEKRFYKGVTVEGSKMSCLYLRDQFQVSGTPPGQSTIIELIDQSFRKGIIVDRIIGEMQAVIKPLGSFFKDQNFITGVTILGDGTIALVLDVHQLDHSHKTKVYSYE